MTVKLSLSQKLAVSKDLTRISKCQTKSIGWWIREKDYLKEESQPLGKQVLNSCRHPLCANCFKRKLYSKKIDIYNKLPLTPYYYLISFSPRKEFWFYTSNFKLVRTYVIDAIQEIFPDASIILAPHYFGDVQKKSKKIKHIYKGKLRLHFHILVCTAIEYNSVSLKHVNQFNDYPDLKDYQRKDKGMIYKSIEAKLSNSKTFNYTAFRNKFKDVFAFNLFFQDVVKIEKEKGNDFGFDTKEKIKKSLMRIAGYIYKYLAFKDFVKVEAALKYYNYFKMNIVVYAGVLKGRKVPNIRERKTKPKFYRGFKMKFLSNFKLRDYEMRPVDIDEWYDVIQPNNYTALTNYLKGVAVS